MEETRRIGLAEAEDLVARALTATGVPVVAARSVGAALVAAEAEGQVGHGFSRLEDYAAQVRSGKVRAGATVAVARRGHTLVVVDAGFGFAYPALDRGLVEGAAIAQDFGTAAVAVCNSHHCGALSVQVDRLAQRGLVAFMFANTPAAIAPWGAREPLYGTNPIAFAAPRRGCDPLVIDLSLSRVARGKVMRARQDGVPIPEGWALDAAGDPTTDPERALAGSMLPIGGAKGTALALAVEVLAAAMTGSSLSVEASSFFDADGSAPGTGQFLVILRPPDRAGFAERIERLLGLVVAAEGARLPGARRAAAIAAARADGIDVPLRYVRAAEALAAGAD